MGTMFSSVFTNPKMQILNRKPNKETQQTQEMTPKFMDIDNSKEQQNEKNSMPQTAMANVNPKNSITR